MDAVAEDDETDNNNMVSAGEKNNYICGAYITIPTNAYNIRYANVCIYAHIYL